MVKLNPTSGMINWWKIIGLTMLLVLMHMNNGVGQSETDKTPPPEIKGYVKFLSIGTNINLPFYEDYLSTQLLHHRLNLRWDFHPKWVFRVGWRNQLFYGDQVELDPSFGENLILNQDDFFGLSEYISLGDKALLNTTLDRLYMEYYAGDLEIALGRQRINWGINTIWNPNDIFNAFSFVDFDYEERPGSDAILARYYLGDVSSIEIAGKFHGEKEKVVIGGLWKFNTSGYDFQLLGGYANGYWVVGNGWAGNIKNAGWKGEWSWFIDDDLNRDNTFLITTAIDYSFTNGWYISGGYLYNHSGSGGGSISGLLAFDVSAQNLYPYKHAIMLSNIYPITPLFSAGLTTIYSPNSSHSLFLVPVITYSLKQSLDLDFTTQIGMENGESYYSPIQAFYLRLKWSY
jgi:hypothetical protein